MNAFSNFEKKVTTPPVWRPERAPTFNYLCGKPNCYSTCYVDDNIVSALLLVQFQPLPCEKCHHSHSSHFHAFAKWVQKQESQMTVDDDMKKKWMAAKAKKEKIEALVAASERTLDDTMDEGMDELVRAADEYAGLSLSGSFSGPLEKAIRLLELHYKSMEEQGVSRDQLDKMRGSVETMKKRLDLLRKAKEKVAVTNASVAVQGGAKATKEELFDWLNGLEVVQGARKADVLEVTQGGATKAKARQGGAAATKAKEAWGAVQGLWKR